MENTRRRSKKGRACGGMRIMGIRRGLLEKEEEEAEEVESRIKCIVTVEGRKMENSRTVCEW